MADKFAGAIPVRSVAEEYEIIRRTKCSCGGTFVVGPAAGTSSNAPMQALLRDEVTQKSYDEIHARCSACGADRAFLFDITSFYGREGRASKPSNSSCLGVVLLVVVGGILAFLLFAVGMIALFSSGAPVTQRAVGGAMVAAAVIIYALIRRQTSLPPELPGGPPPSGASLEYMLNELGLALDFSESTPESALVGAMAKHSVVQAHYSLKNEQFDNAIKASSMVIEARGIKDHPRLAHTLAVAHFLRASAFEKKGMKEPARADYQRALEIWPEHTGAKAGLARCG